MLLPGEGEKGSRWIPPPTAVLRARQQQRMNRSGVGWVPLWTVEGEAGCRGGSWAHGGQASHTDPMVSVGVSVLLRSLLLLTSLIF